MTDDAVRGVGCQRSTDDATEAADMDLVLVDRELLVALRRRARGLDRLLDQLLAVPAPGVEQAASG